jgi:hypothetical protein
MSGIKELRITFGSMNEEITEGHRKIDRKFHNCILPKIAS